MTPKNRIKTLPDLIKTLTPLRKKGRKVVFTNGCFDILHKGHVRLLEKAKSLGDVLIVALNTDASVKKIKGPKRPITKQGDRAFIAAALRSVDFVTFFGENTPEKIIKKISPDVLVKGGDWKKGGIAGADYIRSLGGKVYSVDFVEGYSTSGIVKKNYSAITVKKLLADKRIIRIIDANTNRLTEGLRVCEDIARFMLDDEPATSRFKSIRHIIFPAVKNLGADKRVLMQFRDSDGDIGKPSIRSEKSRGSVADVFKANIKRSEESMRVLEEFAKLSSSVSADRFKKMRFELYSLEKALIEKL